MHSPDGMTCENSVTVRNDVDPLDLDSNLGSNPRSNLSSNVGGDLVDLLDLDSVYDTFDLAPCEVSVKVLVSESADVSLNGPDMWAGEPGGCSLEGEK